MGLEKVDNSGTNAMSAIVESGDWRICINETDGKRFKYEINVDKIDNDIDKSKIRVGPNSLGVEGATQEINTVQVLKFVKTHAGIDEIFLGASEVMDTIPLADEIFGRKENICKKCSESQIVERAKRTNEMGLN